MITNELKQFLKLNIILHPVLGFTFNNHKHHFLMLYFNNFCSTSLISLAFVSVFEYVESFGLMIITNTFESINARDSCFNLSLGIPSALRC
jgi:hypothetical protein